MSEQQTTTTTTASTAQNPSATAAALDPAAWQQLVEQQLARLQTNVEAIEQLQARGREQLVATVEQVTSEMNRLFKAQLDYVSAMQQEWQKLSLDAVRRSSAPR